jgi:hypothetical protein
VSDTTIVLLIFAFVFAVLFGSVFLIEQKSKAQGKTGKSSCLIRIGSIMAVLVGIAFLLLTRFNMLMSLCLIPLIAFLVGYVIFPSYRTINTRSINEDNPQKNIAIPDTTDRYRRERSLKITVAIINGVVIILFMIWLYNLLF